MSIEQACAAARRRRDLYDMDVHVLHGMTGEYFTVLSINLQTFLNAESQKDKHIYYTAWFMTK
jgi:hypothetical protein